VDKYAGFGILLIVILLHIFFTAIQSYRIAEANFLKPGELRDEVRWQTFVSELYMFGMLMQPIADNNMTMCIRILLVHFSNANTNQNFSNKNTNQHFSNIENNKIGEINIVKNNTQIKIPKNKIVEYIDKNKIAIYIELIMTIILGILVICFVRKNPKLTKILLRVLSVLLLVYVIHEIYYSYTITTNAVNVCAFASTNINFQNNDKKEDSYNLSI
jgi:hypothetical protein